MFLTPLLFRAGLRRVQRWSRALALAATLVMTGLAMPQALAQAQADELTETDIVLELQDGLVRILNDTSPRVAQERSAAFTKLVESTFDINAMGAVAVGLDTYRNWTDEQRADFLTAFARFMVATHASRFEDVRDPDFQIEGSEDARAGRKIVHARYLRVDKDPVSIDYLVRPTKDGWRVLDVYLDGTVSLLALHRSEFASVLRAKGFDGFIAAMNAKADELNPG